MEHTLFYFVVLSLIVNAFGQATIPCSFVDPETLYEYNLTPLVNNQGDYVIEVPTGTDSSTTMGYKITLNICRPIFNQACSAQGGVNCDACQQWPLDSPKYQAALGSTTATSFGRGLDKSGDNREGVTMYFAGFQSTIALNFICDPDAGDGHPVYVEKPTSTSYFLQWKSYYGCATNGPAVDGSSSSSSYINLPKQEAFFIVGITFACGCLLGAIIASFCWCIKSRSKAAKKKPVDESRVPFLASHNAAPSAPPMTVSEANISNY